MKLRELELIDIRYMLEWMKDPDISRVFTFSPENMTEETVKSFILNSKNDPKNVHFAIVDDHNEYMGTVSLKNINLQAKNAEYAISTRKVAHGKGIARFATIEILKYAFDTLDLKRVYLDVLVENERANRFYLKFGFVYEGQFVNHLYHNGELKSINWYRMLKSEFSDITSEE
jgi:RimJ/RimL family protein N-acetyltransferase